MQIPDTRSHVTLRIHLMHSMPTFHTLSLYYIIYTLSNTSTLTTALGLEVLLGRNIAHPLKISTLVDAPAQGQRTDAQGQRTDAQGQRTDAQGQKTGAQGQKIDAQGQRTNGLVRGREGGGHAQERGVGGHDRENGVEGHAPGIVGTDALTLGNAGDQRKEDLIQKIEEDNAVSPTMRR